MGHTFIDSQDKFWSLYLADAEKYDKHRMESWKGDTDGILIFTGLFAATVATFTVASYDMLSPDPNDRTEALLMTLVAFNLNSPQVVTMPQRPAFRASTSAVCINAFWMISLFLALACALAATLVQQWARRYAHHVQRRAPPRIRGPIHVVLSMGLRRFGLNQAVASIIGTLHVSVGLFLAGLGIYMSSANDTIAYFIAGIMGIGALSYGFVTVLPLACTDSPYVTPLTPFLRIAVTSACRLLAFSGTLSAKLIGLARLFVASSRLKHQRQWLEDRVDATYSWAASLRDKRMKFARDLAEKPTVSRETFAIRQTMKNIDEIHELETLCDALLAVVQPIRGTRWDMAAHERAKLAVYLLRDLRIMDHIGELVLSISTPGARDVHIRRLIIGFRLCRAFTMAINLEDRTGPLFGTVRLELSAFLRTWSSVAVNETRPDITFLAACFLSAIRNDIYAHHLYTVGPALSQTRSYSLGAVIAGGMKDATLDELFGSTLSPDLQPSHGDDWSSIHTFMCYNYVHLFRDILSYVSPAVIRTSDTHALVWLPILRDTHSTLCAALGDMRRPCLDILESLLKDVDICHRQPTGVLLMPPGSSGGRAGQEDPEDAYRIVFLHYPELADMLHALWAQMRERRPDIGYCTPCYLFREKHAD
ncbi:unnamed protein product [Peniophora sp. CBMAI 1063]|nr:unnamed protein product [Peniophora sp. CBMAI 1063]